MGIVVWIREAIRHWIGVALHILTRIHDGCLRQLSGIRIVTAASKVVVGIPGVRRGEDRNLRGRLFGRYNPGKGKESFRKSASVNVVESGALRGRQTLAKDDILIPYFVPLHAGLRVISI